MDKVSEIKRLSNIVQQIEAFKDRKKSISEARDLLIVSRCSEEDRMHCYNPGYIKRIFEEISTEDLRNLILPYLDKKIEELESQLDTTKLCSLESE